MLGSNEPLAMYGFADVAKLAERDVFEAAAAAIQMLVDLGGRLLHHFMRLLRATAEQEVLAPRDPGVAVFGVEGETKQTGFLLRTGSSHINWLFNRPGGNHQGASAIGPLVKV
jgi:hypothetical protein